MNRNFRWRRTSITHFGSSYLSENFVKAAMTEEDFLLGMNAPPALS
jgi:hypothetical protein